MLNCYSNFSVSLKCQHKKIKRKKKLKGESIGRDENKQKQPKGREFREDFVTGQRKLITKAVFQEFKDLKLYTHTHPSNIRG